MTLGSSGLGARRARETRRRSPSSHAISRWQRDRRGQPSPLSGGKPRIGDVGRTVKSTPGLRENGALRGAPRERRPLADACAARALQAHVAVHRRQSGAREEKRGGAPRNRARIPRLGPHGPQPSQGGCGSLPCLADHRKVGREGHAGPARGRTTRQTRRVWRASAASPHGRGSTARNRVRPRVVSVARSRKATPDPKKRRRVTPPTLGGPGPWPRV